VEHLFYETCFRQCSDAADRATGACAASAVPAKSDFRKNRSTIVDNPTPWSYFAVFVELETQAIWSMYSQAPHIVIPARVAATGVAVGIVIISIPEVRP